MTFLKKLILSLLIDQIINNLEITKLAEYCFNKGIAYRLAKAYGRDQELWNLIKDKFLITREYLTNNVDLWTDLAKQLHFFDL